MDEEVVLVTIQYRLGPLGFLSLQNEDIKVRQCTIQYTIENVTEIRPFLYYLHVHMFPQEQHVLILFNNIV